MDGRLWPRSALIVGGTGGIGKWAALAFALEGASVVISGIEPEDEGQRLAASHAEAGPCSYVRCDITDESSVLDLFDRALVLLDGRLDILLHVAGGSGRRHGDGPLHECTAEGWDRTLALNARGAFLCNREAVRRMLAQDRDGTGLRGSIVNVGSVLAASPSPHHFGTLAYAASKAALAAMTTTAAARYASDGIRLNLIEPGLIDTPMASRACEDDAIRHYLGTKQPIRGGPGNPNDVVAAALYLAGPSSRFVTGATLRVDGGWSISEGQIR